MTTSTATEILVFKTNVQRKKDLSLLGSYLDTDQRISHWNVDRDDVDRVLRIASIDIEPGEVIEIVEKAGFVCEELPD